MRERKVTRYYCDHCGMSKGTRPAMVRHERGCTLNPERACGLCDMAEQVNDLPATRRSVRCGYRTFPSSIERSQSTSARTGKISSHMERSSVASSLSTCISTNDWQPVTGCDEWLCGNWERDRFGWKRAPEFVCFETPIPYVGRQGFFSVPDEVLRDARVAA